MCIRCVPSCFHCVPLYFRWVLIEFHRVFIVFHLLFSWPGASVANVIKKKVKCDAKTKVITEERAARVQEQRPVCRSMLIHDIHDIPIYSMMSHTVPWYSVISMTSHAIPWYPAAFHDTGVFHNIHAIPRYSSIFHDIPCHSTIFHDVPWYSMASLGCDPYLMSCRGNSLARQLII